jgi:hypothetical protein
VKNNDLIIAAAIVGGVVLLMPKVTNKVTEKIGTSAGTAAANLTSKPIAVFTEKTVENVLVEPYQWSKKQTYIPIIDEAALAADKILGLQDYGVYPANYGGLRLPQGFPFSRIKGLGNPDKWFS